MPGPLGAYRRLARLATTVLIVFLVLLALWIAYEVALLATALSLEEAPLLLLLRQGLRVLGLVALAPLLVLTYGLVLSWLRSATAIRTLNDRAGRLAVIQDANQQALRELADIAPLSDQAKALVFREREIEAVREVIHECLARQDYRQAEQFIERMASQFGYHAEAERFRAEVLASREASTEGKIHAAVQRVEALIQQGNWARAQRETERLRQIFPESQAVQALPQHLADARNQHKKDLLRLYSDAVRRNDVDRSIELLRELDRYLTPQEAAALEESARGVFRAKLHNLGVQFAIAVTEERWDQAARTGEQIVSEFPNTRMAAEVREKLDALHHRAAAETAGE